VIPVVADANTLFGATTRGLLIHLDYRGLIRLHWSPLILDELSRALVDTGRKPDREAARRHEQLMRAAIPQAELPVALVQRQFEAVAPAMRSTKDMHVAACAHALIVGGYYPKSEVVSLVTHNVRDFGVRTRRLGHRGRPSRYLPARSVSSGCSWRCRCVRGVESNAAVCTCAGSTPRALVRGRTGPYRGGNARRRPGRDRETLTARATTLRSSSSGQSRESVGRCARFEA
jgi:PIN domain